MNIMLSVSTRSKNFKILSSLGGSDRSPWFLESHNPDGSVL